MKSFVRRHFNWYAKKIKGDSVDAYAAQVAFFIIIAFIPFVLFLLSLLQTININGSSLMSAALQLFPLEVQDFLSYILLQQQEPIALISAAALTCLWSSSKAMISLIKGLNSVFDVAETRNFIWLRIVSVGYTVIFAAILAATAVLLVFGNTIVGAIYKSVGATGDLGFLESKSLVGFIILALFFTFSYKIIPRKSRTRLRYCMVGGALAAAGWVLFSFFFSIFVENFSNYAGMYGSLAALVILMLWLYFCMYILFLGGETAMWLERSGIEKDFAQLRLKKLPKK